MRFDPTPLPAPRPPTIDFPAFDPKKIAKPSARRPWLYALLFAALAAAAIVRLLELDASDRRAIAAARDEAAEHRAARFIAEAEAQRLAAENRRLVAAPAAPDLGALSPAPPQASPPPKSQATP